MVDLYTACVMWAEQNGNEPVGETSFTLQDLGDGKGPFIAKWAHDSPQPGLAQLQALDVKVVTAYKAARKVDKSLSVSQIKHPSPHRPCHTYKSQGSTHDYHHVKTKAPNTLQHIHHQGSFPTVPHSHHCSTKRLRTHFFLLFY